MNFQYKDNENISIFQIFFFVPKARVELAHLYRWQILSLLGLPFPHLGI